MQPPPRQYPALVFHNYIVTVFVIAIGYIVSFVSAILNHNFFSPLETAVTILAGVIYTFLCLKPEWLLRQLTSKWKTAVYFTLQLFLCTLVVAIIPAGPIWLIFMPLVGAAAEMLPPFGQGVVYSIVVAGLVLPIGLRYENAWDDAFYSGLTFTPAIFFVVIFTKARINEENARKRAEQLSIKLETANRQLGEYATQSAELATTQERNRLAREIHDNLGHYLTVVNVQIEAARLLMENQPNQAKEALEKAQRLTQEGLTAVRQSVSTLRESPTENKPLPEAIARLIDESQSAGILTELAVRGTPRMLEAKTTLTLYRVVQEGLTNVRKHARASRVDLSLDYRQPETVKLTIQDNGVGTAVPGNGFGLLGLRERVQQLGGRVELQTAPGEGFALMVAVPG